MLGFVIIILFNLLGVALNKLASIPIPGNVIGMVLFTLALFLKLIKLEWVERSASWLLSHMMLFFAPLIVGVIVFLPLIREQWISIIVSMVVSTFFVLIVTGWIAEKLGKEEEQHEQHKHS